MPHTSVFLRYCGWYFVSISFYSFVLAFLPLHCKALGFTPFQIAVVSSSATCAAIVGAPLVLQLAHYLIPPRALLLLSSALGFLAFLVLFRATAFWPVLLFFFICLILKRGSDSLVDAQAIRHSATGEIRFERVRLWGSLGFICVTFGFGEMIDSWGTFAIIPSGAVVLFVCLLAAAVILPLFCPVTGRKAHEVSLAEASSRAKFLPAFALLAFSCSFLWASHSTLYVYLSIYLKSLGWSGKEISLAWNLGVIAEITIFFLFHKLEKHFTLTMIFQASIAVAVLRWLLMYWSKNFYVILFAQTLHAFSFGSSYVASLKLVHLILPEHLKDRGQGMLMSSGTGLGSLLGYLAAGAVATCLQGYEETNKLFLFSIALALCSLLAALHIRPQTRPEAGKSSGVPSVYGP